MQARPAQAVFGGLGSWRDDSFEISTSLLFMICSIFFN